MKGHRTDLVSFAFGLIFLALAAWWLSAQLLGLALPPVCWVLAGALILIGVLGLIGALRSGRYVNQDESGVPGAPAVGPTSGLPTDVTAPIAGAGSPLAPPASSSGAGAPGPGTDRPTEKIEPPVWEAGWTEPSDTAPEPGHGSVERQGSIGGIHPAWQVDRPTREIDQDEGPTREIDQERGPTRAVSRDADEPPAWPGR